MAGSSGTGSERKLPRRYGEGHLALTRLAGVGVRSGYESNDVFLCSARRVACRLWR